MTDIKEKLTATLDKQKQTIEAQKQLSKQLEEQRQNATPTETVPLAPMPAQLPNK